MKKVLHYLYIALMRFLYFIMWLVLSPFCIILGIAAAVASLAGAFDEMYDPDCNIVKPEENYTDEQIKAAKEIVEGEKDKNVN